MRKNRGDDVPRPAPGRPRHDHHRPRLRTAHDAPRHLPHLHAPTPHARRQKASQAASAKRRCDGVNARRTVSARRCQSVNCTLPQARADAAKSRLLRGSTRGRDFLRGMTDQHRGHSERNAARAKAGRHGVEESRESTAEARTSFFHATGFFTARRSTANARTDAPFRMTSYFDAIALAVTARPSSVLRGRCRAARLRILRAAAACHCASLPGSRPQIDS